MSGIKDFFVDTIDTLDKFANSDTVKLYTDYEQNKLDKKIETNVRNMQNTELQNQMQDQHNNILRTNKSISDAAHQNTISVESLTKYVPYGLALLIPLFFFMYMKR